MYTMRTITLNFLLSCFSIVSWAEDEFKGRVTSVIDGNTIEVLSTDKETYTVLLHGIDCPDPGQHFAEQAKKYLEDLLLNKEITIQLKGKDRKGNRIGEIHIKDGATDPRAEMVRAGLAWTTEPIEELEELKERARSHGKGLWQDENPTPPWLYRRQQSMMQAKSS